MIMLDLQRSRSANSCMTSVGEIVGEAVDFEVSRVRTLPSRTLIFLDIIIIELIFQKSVITPEISSNLEDNL